MRKIALPVWIMLGLGIGIHVPLAIGQTQVVPPVAGTGGANAPATAALPAAPSALTSKPIGPARISGDVLRGFRVSFIPPDYPGDARAAGLTGQVVLHVLISKEGTVDNLQVASSTNPIFDQAAMDAVRQWRYRSYLLNGEPTEVDSTVTINFMFASPAH